MANNITKINVRSPYFVNAIDGEDVVEQLPEYVQPATKTQNVFCGDEVNVGTDVGAVIYKLETNDRIGAFTLSYVIDIPIKFSITYDGTTTETTYYGNSDYSNQLLDAGVSQSQLSTLTTGAQATGTINLVTKTAADPSEIQVRVLAPIPTDSYKLTFNCPAAPVAPTEPVIDEVTFTNNEIFEPILGVIFKGEVNYSNIKINGTTLASVVNDDGGATINLNGDLFRSNENERYFCVLFTDYTATECPFNIGRSTRASGFFDNAVITRASKSTYIKATYNVIEYVKTAKGLSGEIFVLDTGIFNDTDTTTRIAVPSESEFFGFGNYDVNWKPGNPFGYLSSRSSLESNRVGVYALDDPRASLFRTAAKSFAETTVKFTWNQRYGFITGEYFSSNRLGGARDFKPQFIKYLL